MFRLFRFYTETESFDVSIEPKQTEDQPKQFDREHILLFCTENLGFFRFFRFSFFSVVSKQLFRLIRFYTETESFNVSIEPKQTEDPPTPKQTEFFSFWFHVTNRNKRETDLVSVCFGSNRNLFLFFSRTP